VIILKINRYEFLKNAEKRKKDDWKKSGDGQRQQLQAPITVQRVSSPTQQQMSFLNNNKNN
jgi:hypothetical protein